jgi:hypothetical protein
MSTIAEIAYPECCKCIGADFKIAFIDPLKKVPEHTVAILWKIGLQLRESDCGLSLV